MAPWQPGQSWQAYRDAAAEAMAKTAAAGDPVPVTRSCGGQLKAHLGLLLRRARDRAGAWANQAGTAGEAGQPRAHGSAARGGMPGARRRTDLRLVPATLLVWGTAVAGAWLTPAGIAILCALLATGTGVFLLLRLTWPATRGSVPLHELPDGLPRSRRRALGRQAAAHSAGRSIRATGAAALALAAAAGSHAAVGSAQRHDGDVAAALAAHASIVAELDIAAAPQRISAPPGSTDSTRWSVDATLRVLVFDGRRVDAGVPVVVLGGPEWGRLQHGQRIRTTGKLKAAETGRAEAGTLAATTAPVPLAAPAGTEWGEGVAPARLRSGFTAASSGLTGDARGLLPGMVTGDTSAVDPELAAAMKTVGMTHLTAVSGANCSLVLGALLLAARSLRLPRPAAAGIALAGLGLFVAMVGPDASVLRAACMGAIGLVGLAAGRSGRGLSLLCVAATVLLLTDPALATDFGFLLSVLATLGIVTAGRPIMDWLPAVVPRPLAAGLAVPLSAQLYCGPVIVLLQPQFASYALAANLTAAVLVPPVTLVGTGAVPLVPVLPVLAAVPIAVAGAFAAAVGAVGRFFAGLPGASLPWPEGGFGAATMALFSAVSLAAVWVVTHPSAARRRVLILHARTVRGVTHVLEANAGPPAGEVRAGQGARGLVDRVRRGTLRVCNQTLRRYHQWLLPKPNAPGPRRRTPPPGAM